MEQIAVIVNRETTSHVETYLSYQIAARSGSELVGIAELDFQPLEEAERSMNLFLLGARAAGIRARTFLIPNLTNRAIKRLELDISIIILGMELWSNNLEVKNFIGQSNLPVWLVPEGQHNIRRALIVVKNAPFKSAAVFHGLDLARKWNMDLVVEGIEEQDNKFKFFSELDWIHIPVSLSSKFDLEKIKAAISSELIDLVMIDRELLLTNGWDWACCENCILGIYPPLKPS